MKNSLETWKLIEQAGFKNRNIDLMSALPGQTIESYEETLSKVLSLEPEHVSAYSLILKKARYFTTGMKKGIRPWRMETSVRGRRICDGRVDNTKTRRSR